MTAGGLPPIQALRDRAAAQVEALRGVVAAGATLVAVEASATGILLEHQAIGGAARIAADVPGMLARRARAAAGIGAEHDVLVAPGRAVLAAPRGALEAIIGALRAGARAVVDGTGDAVWVDLAWRDLRADALDEAGRDSMVEALDDLLEADLARARLRRAEGAPTQFWTPERAPRAMLDDALAEPDASPERDAPLRVEGRGGSFAGSLACLDLDAVGRALHAVIEGKPAAEAMRDRLALWEAIRLACGAAADPGRARGGPPIHDGFVLPGGEMALLAPWPDLVEVAIAARDAVAPYLAEIARALGGDRGARFLDVSAGLAIGASGPPLGPSQPRAALRPQDLGTPFEILARQAAEELRRAKGVRHTRQGDRRKAALSVRGIVVGWGDARLAAELGGLLGSAMAAGQIPRSFLRRLAGIHALWRRAEEALDAAAPWSMLRGSAGTSPATPPNPRSAFGGAAAPNPRAAAEASKRRWRWAWQLTAGKAGSADSEGARLVARVAKLALENVDEGAAGAPRRTEQDAAAWLGLTAELADQRARARREEHE